MISIHDYETIIFYTVTSLALFGIFTLILILVFAPYNDYQINIKNIITIPQIWNLNNLYNNIT